jgi:hypothetical protein
MEMSICPSQQYRQLIEKFAARVQRILFGLLSPLARLLGYRGSYPEYSTRGPSAVVAVEPLNVAAVPVPGSP